MGIFDPDVMGSGGAVDSVSNTDGSLVVSPTTANVVASVNTAHSNTFTANQNIGNLILSATKPSGSTGSAQIGADTSGNIWINPMGSSIYIGMPVGSVSAMVMTPAAINFYASFYFQNNAGINNVGNMTFAPYSIYTFNMQAQPATSTTTSAPSSILLQNGSYWNGTAAIPYGIQTQFIQDSTTPSGHLSFILNNNGTLTADIAKIDNAGNLTTNGWAYIKGKNRNYQQNLTASTTTSTTPTLFGTSIGFTPQFSGYIIIEAFIRASNNTLNDGVSVGVYQGASSGALTTLLDSQTYTQEGVASNEHTFTLHFEISGQALGTATWISLAMNAVTGGTASAKIVKFTLQEV